MVLKKKVLIYLWVQLITTVTFLRSDTSMKGATLYDFLY
jgi:hypothetical protein